MLQIMVQGMFMGYIQVPHHLVMHITLLPLIQRQEQSTLSTRAQEMHTVCVESVHTIVVQIRR